MRFSRSAQTPAHASEISPPCVDLLRRSSGAELGSKQSLDESSTQGSHLVSEDGELQEALT
jgi:hypothetical protein